MYLKSINSRPFNFEMATFKLAMSRVSLTGKKPSVALGVPSKLDNYVTGKFAIGD